MTRISGGEARSKTEGRDPRTAMVLDPCVGTGRMLLHASNFSLSLWGIDVDPTCVAITRINGALYAPWISFPFKERVLGHRPAPPPAPLPLPEELALTATVQKSRRVDDRQLRLLY